MNDLLHRFRRDESGATAIEYGLIAALVALAVIGTLKIIGTRLNAKLGAISAQMN